jgi:hypothetical protein
MSEMMSEGLYEEGVREHQHWAYDRMAHERAEQDREDRARGHVDIGGFNVPYNLQGMVFEHSIHPDEVCAVSDLFESTEDYERMRDNQSAFVGGRIGQDDLDPRIAEVDARWARLDEEKAARQQSGLFPQR